MQELAAKSRSYDATVQELAAKSRSYDFPEEVPHRRGASSFPARETLNKSPTVIPAKAGIHLDIAVAGSQIKMDPSFRWGDDVQTFPRETLNKSPTVIPAKAGIHLDVAVAGSQIKMDPSFRWG